MHVHSSPTQGYHVRTHNSATVGTHKPNLCAHANEPDILIPVLIYERHKLLSQRPRSVITNTHSHAHMLTHSTQRMSRFLKLGSHCLHYNVINSFS